ncbi:AcrR family transcriptional regulator [Streptomyces calvus]
MTSVEEPARPGERIRDAARTRAEILDVATQEFARAGYDGARVDEIAARTRTTKRMIYYYFGGKEQLFTAVLERAYGVIREAEQQLDVDHLDPVAAVRRLAELTFDHPSGTPTSSAWSASRTSTAPSTSRPARSWAGWAPPPWT